MCCWLCLGHTFTDNSPGLIRMKMVRMMPEILISLSYYGISTIKNGLIRFRYGNFPVDVRKRTGPYGLLRSITDFKGMIRSSVVLYKGCYG